MHKRKDLWMQSIHRQFNVQLLLFPYKNHAFLLSLLMLFQKYRQLFWYLYWQHLSIEIIGFCHHFRLFFPFLYIYKICTVIFHDRLNTDKNQFNVTLIQGFDFATVAYIICKKETIFYSKSLLFIVWMILLRIKAFKLKYCNLVFKWN